MLFLIYAFYRIFCMFAAFGQFLPRDATHADRGIATASRLYVCP